MAASSKISWLVLFASVCWGCSGELEPSGDDDAGTNVAVDAAREDAGTTEVDAGPPPGCSQAVSPGKALVLDGVDDRVSAGVAPDLGLAELTIEAWVRRDGLGVTTNSGAGGLVFVPIAGKGRGEHDGSNVDCNYAFGFHNGVLGADFEDMESGANHPIVGTTAIPFGEWHHVAATYDGSTWRLYVDGHLDAERTVDATPRHDSIQHFGIGTTYNSTGGAAGFFDGAIDEVRVWDHARTEDEIAADMRHALTSGDGLLARWGFETLSGSTPDSVGDHDGAVEGAVLGDGMPLDAGEPPAVSAAAPLDDAEVSGDSVELGVTIDDPDSASFTATFYARELTEQDDFTIVVMPDTQNYTRNGNENHFYAQTRWIADHRNSYNIVAVIHNGDLVNNGDTYQSQWEIADRAMTTLETSLPGLFDGIPYGIAPGNHDETPNGTAGNTRSFNEWFGVDRFRGRAYYGGHYGSKNDESWFTFMAGGLQFVVVNMQYDTTPDAAVLSWAREVLTSNPHAFGIVNSHYIIGRSAGFGAQGQAIYDALKDVDNLQLMTCGHVGAESRRTDTYEGNVIHSMLADYQFLEEGGYSNMRIWELSPANDTLTVRTYAPSRDEWETDEDSEFTLSVDLSGAGGPFSELGSAAAQGNEARLTLGDLEPGHVYEWYVEISDCRQTARSPIYRFTTP